MKRLITALVLLPIVVAVILAGGEWAVTALLAITGLLAYYEFDQLAAGNGIARAGCPGMAAGLALLLAPDPGTIVVLIALLGMALALRVRDLKDSMASAGAFTLGVVCIFGAWRCARELHAISPHWLMFALLLSWAGDTAALYIGKAFGRRKLAPRVSPAKTWEGATASLAGGLLVGGIYAHFLLPTAPLSLVLLLAGAGNIAGQIGDLSKSAWKRGAGVKDSGTMLPGHGGWLDRIDASLFAVPVVYALLKLYRSLTVAAL
jgi:phosphatidate cytidylyltransferase